VGSSVPEKDTVSTFCAEGSLQPWRWIQYVPP